MDEWKRFTNWWTSGGAPILIGVVVAAVFVAAVVFGVYAFVSPRFAGHQPRVITAIEEATGFKMDIMDLSYNLREDTIELHAHQQGSLTQDELADASVAVDDAIESFGLPTPRNNEHGFHSYFYHVNNNDVLVITQVNHCTWEGELNSVICSRQMEDFEPIVEQDTRWRNPK